MKANVVDLRYRTREILQAVSRNEKVHLLYRGKEKAVIVPSGISGGKRTRVVEHPAFGLWKNRPDMKDVSGYVKQIRRGRFHAL